MRALISVALVLCLGTAAATSARAQYLNYSDWEKMGGGARAVYAEGVFDHLVWFRGSAAANASATRLLECMTKAQMTGRELADNVLAWATERTDLHQEPAVAAIVLYLYEFCGLY